MDVLESPQPQSVILPVNITLIYRDQQLHFWNDVNIPSAAAPSSVFKVCGVGTSFLMACEDRWGLKTGVPFTGITENRSSTAFTATSPAPLSCKTANSTHQPCSSAQLTSFHINMKMHVYVRSVREALGSRNLSILRRSYSALSRACGPQGRAQI